ncbi:MAG: FAD:protein FMN transferase [bacterium]
MDSVSPGLILASTEWKTHVHRFNHPAMATVFEIFIADADGEYARQAAREAFEELDRLEGELSRFIPTSDISRINQAPPGQAVRIGLESFECLSACARLYEKTFHTFDITLGRRIDEWKYPNSGSLPSAEWISPEAGRPFPLELNAGDHTARWTAGGLLLDLGGYGKGYAVDRMAERLRDWGLEAVLLHGGTSTVIAMLPPPGREGWPITLSDPQTGGVIRKTELRGRAVSGSGLGKGAHILDPRTGRPVERTRAAWAFAPGAAESDAHSTAFMIMTPGEIQGFLTSHPDTEAVVLEVGDLKIRGGE